MLKQIAYATNAGKLGLLGELVVLKAFGGRLSDDTYDDNKDIILPDGQHCEVKTQERFWMKNAFSVRADRQSNLNKCLNVDKLYFVEYDFSDTIKIWDCEDRAYFTTRTSRGEMVCWPIDKMNLIYSYNSPKISTEMRRLSSSTNFR